MAARACSPTLRCWRLVSVAAFLTLLLLAFGAATGVRAATVTANIFNDPTPGACAMSGTGNCSLREAVLYANANPSTVIVLSAHTYTLQIAPTSLSDPSSGDLNITASTTITGNGATVDAHGIDEAFKIENAAHVGMTNLTVTGGLITDSGAAYLSGGGITLRSGTVLGLTNCIITGNHAFYGGGILNLGGALSLEGTTVSTNIATDGGGGISTGILSANGSLTINDSSIVGNTGGGGGGGIAIGSGTAIIANTLIANNHVPGVSGFQNSGGGIGNEAMLTISTSTISGNTASGSGGGILNFNGTLHADSLTVALNNPSGITNATSATVTNTLLASNPPAGTAKNCDGLVSSNDYNLSTDGTCTDFKLTHDQQNAVASLAPLADNGGPTQTHALLPDSHAIDFGPAATGGCTGTDQRIIPRPQGPDCDIGAFERQYHLPALVRSGSFYLRNSLTTGYPDIAFGYGLSSDIPLLCDWDGNGTKTPGIFRNGTWAIRNSASGGPPDAVFSFGQAGDIPLCGDWDGNRTETVGIFRSGSFILRNSNSTGPPDLLFAFGAAGDTPVVGDWNHDGIVTVGIFRSGTWALRNSNSAGTPDLLFAFGAAGDVPIVGDWDGNLSPTIGVFRSGTWILRNSVSAGAPNAIFSYGASGDRPLIWR